MGGWRSPPASRRRSWRNAAGTASPSTCSTVSRTTRRWCSAFRRWTGFPVTKLVRVPWNEPGIVGKVLTPARTGSSARWSTRPEEARALVLTPLSAQGSAQQRTDPRRRLRRGRRLPEDRERRDSRHPDDRDAASGREHRRDTRRAGDRARSMSARGSGVLDGQDTGARQRGAEQLGMYEKLLAACKSAGSIPASIAAHRPMRRA